MHFYTTSPAVLDFESTREIEPRVARGRDRNNFIRLIDVKESGVGGQVTCAHVHFHAMLRAEEFAIAITAQTVSLLNPVNYVYIYTDAPVDYDYHNCTIEVCRDIASTRRGKKLVRLVLIERNQENLQCGRYGSGLHMSLHQEDFDREIANEKYGLVVSHLRGG